MFTSLFGQNVPLKEQKHKEGELYKVIKSHGQTFEIYYGYYEEIDRQNPTCKPMEIYPNFREKPVYTDKGIPFVTAMQKTCEHYNGEYDEDNTCIQCAYYEKCEELLGICKCRLRRRKNE